MTTESEDSQPIIVADSGPLIRLAAAGLLDGSCGLNRKIILVDRVEDDVIGDVTKPFASEIETWLIRMGDAVERVRTVTGEGIASLRAKARTQEEERLPKSVLRDSGEQAIREFIGRWRPQGSASAVVLYEDRKVPGLFLDIDFPCTLMTTRYFVGLIRAWGINLDAVAALETIAAHYDLKPAPIAEIDPEIPVDLRRLPQPPKE